MHGTDDTTPSDESPEVERAARRAYAAALDGCGLTWGQWREVPDDRGGARVHRNVAVTARLDGDTITLVARRVLSARTTLTEDEVADVREAFVPWRVRIEVAERDDGAVVIRAFLPPTLESEA
jgi:hypothetical protein